MPIGKYEALFCAVVLAAYTLPAIAQDAEQTPVFWAEAQSDQSDFINDVLRSPLNSLGLEFDGAPLEEVVAFLRDEYNIEIQIDVASLDDLGMGPDEPITCYLQNISLGAALRWTLQQLDLTYVIDDEILLITSVDEALVRLTVAVYPVGDLLASKTDGEPEDINVLIDVIFASVAVDTWICNGGAEADIKAIQPGLLVVSATQNIHEQIAGLLRALRDAKEHSYATPHVGESMKRVLEEKDDQISYLREALVQAVRERDALAGDDESKTNGQAMEDHEPPAKGGRGSGVF